MKKIKIMLFSILGMCLLLTACKENNNPGGNGGTPPEVPDEEEVLEIKELEIVSNGNEVIYLGETFTAEGYDINLVYRIVGSGGETKKVKCENYTIDDSLVDYEKMGTYQVTFIARVKNVVLKKPVTIRIADSVLIEAGIEHLYGIKALEYTGSDISIGEDDFSNITTVVYLIYTNCTYENGELVLTEERIFEGVKYDTSFINSSVPGQYPVYVSLEEPKIYDVNGEKITVDVKTFFLVTVKEGN